MDIIETQNKFALHFLYKSKRERALFELTSNSKRKSFLSKLNHQSLDYFDDSNLVAIPKENKNDFSYIKENLLIKDTTMCLVISNDGKLDNRLMTFKEAFTEIYGYGFASILIFENGEKIYLQTEQEQGPAIKFIGKMKNYR